MIFVKAPSNTNCAPKNGCLASGAARNSKGMLFCGTFPAAVRYLRMPATPEQRAERLFRQREDAPNAMAEYRARQDAIRALTSKLRAERLAREAKPETRPRKRRKNALTAIK